MEIPGRQLQLRGHDDGLAMPGPSPKAAIGHVLPEPRGTVQFVGQEAFTDADENQPRLGHQKDARVEDPRQLAPLRHDQEGPIETPLDREDDLFAFVPVVIELFDELGMPDVLPIKRREAAFMANQSVLADDD